MGRLKRIGCYLFEYLFIRPYLWWRLDYYVVIKHYECYDAAGFYRPDYKKDRKVFSLYADATESFEKQSHENGYDKLYLKWVSHSGKISVLKSVIW